MAKTKWSVEEDTILSKLCIEKYVKGKEDLDIETFLNNIMIHKEFEDRDKGSVRMRIQNIKAVLNELGMPNTIPITPLVNASKQTRKILLDILYNINS